MDYLAPLIAATLNSGTPLLLAGLGLLINEKAGVLNLGAEGMMLVGAMAGFAAALTTQSAALGFVCGALAGMGLAAIFAALVIGLNTNQYATGLALSLFGAGFSAFVGIPFVGKNIGLAKMPVPFLADVPFIGTAFFNHHWLVYGSVVFCVAMTYFLFRTRAGLVLRSVGESPESAHALGYSVRGIRVLATLFGGACCGVAGAYLAVVYTPMWVEGMVAGKGWIALALTTFATWRPLRVLAGAYLFGGVTILQLHMQGLGVEVAPQLLSMLPYLATIVVLALISRNPDWIRINMPASLGKPFIPH
jgi:ABC-type uncharacterized transport system permease subunit